MENIVFTQLSIAEVRLIFRQELETYFDQKQESLPQSDELFTIQQAAAFIKLSVPTLYGLVSKLEIPVSKKGKRLYFSKEELTAWIKEGRKKTSAEIFVESSLNTKQKPPKR